MSGLSVLKLVQAKREEGNSPQHARRQKLSTKLAEQIQLAKAQQSGAEFAPVRVRTVKDEATGQNRKVEVPKKLKPWCGQMKRASCASPSATGHAHWKLSRVRTP